MRKVRRIKPVSLAKVQGLMMVLTGVIISAVYLAVTLIAFSQKAPEESSKAVTTVIIILAIPLLYGIFGFVIGFLTGVFYNLVARFTGGIQIELDGVDKAPQEEIK